MRMIWVTRVRVWLVYNLAVVFHWHIMKENMMINRYDGEGQKEESRWFHSCGLSFQRRQCLRGIQRKWLWLTLIFDLRCNYQGWLISTIWRCSSKMSLLIISDKKAFIFDVWFFQDCRKYWAGFCWSCAQITSYIFFTKLSLFQIILF